jgi:phenylacetate-CoA ligase
VLRSAYLRLPYPLKVAAATAQGARLRWWRYGGGLEDRVAAVSERDRWSADRLRAWQDERLATVLAAAAAVPWYRRWFTAHPDRDPARLEDWPIVTKADVRAEQEAFVAPGGGRPRYTDHTSGTTGTPLSIVSSRAALQAWFALYEARARRWHGVSARDRWAILGGQVVARPGRRRPPYWVWNPALGQLYLSSAHVGGHAVGAMAEALRRFAPTHVVVYPSAAAALGRAGREAGVDAEGPRVVITNAEAATPTQRDDIADFFGCPVRETYGMAEMAGGASECQAGALHWWPEAGVLEVLDDDGQPVGPGREGRLVGTGLVNDVMPLVRYDTGDRGREVDWHADCDCGRTLPLLRSLQGRSQDLVLTPDGRRVFWLNPVFYDLAVAEAQIVQEQRDRVRVLVVAAPGWTSAAEEDVRRRLRDRLGDMAVTVDLVDQIPRDPTGKLRPVISRL